MEVQARIAQELNVATARVQAAVDLLDDGATVPFIARYRKEATGGLDDAQLRQLDERLSYLRELEDRRATVIKTIDDDGKLTPALKQALLSAETKTRLEDLYAPYKKKRRTRAQIAREAGLEVVLDSLLENPALVPEVLAEQFINSEAGFTDSKAVLDGARQIFMERAAEEADLVGSLRELVWQDGVMQSRVVDGKQQEGEKFTDYFEFDEALEKIPSHRALAMFRGRSEGVLTLNLKVTGQDDLETRHMMGVCDYRIAKCFGISDQGCSADAWLLECVRWAWRIKLSLQMETECNLKIRERAEEEAIRVFGDNLRDLLLAAPAGQLVTMGLDPGLRTGVKVVVVDGTGKLLDQETIYPHVPKRKWKDAIETLVRLTKKHGVQLVSIGNGTGSRETDKLMREVIAAHPELKLNSLVVSEAGASVYSASALASAEFPDLDVSLRGAVSIARRLQDPLAELVKIEPKAIGVGQYQHDVNQFRLARKLETIIEDCVNAVGVTVNSASVPLLVQVAGLSTSLAENIVAYREKNGAFTSRQQLLDVPRLGAKAYEQAAGFLRIDNGSDPLDASSVHPEAYTVVQKILKFNARNIEQVIGDREFLKGLSASDYTDDKFGAPTVQDIISELEKPGRDPRPEFKTASFQDDVEQIKDLKLNMILEGVVTNVANFGAFVDIGVHQDGLVHISALSDRFVKDPREVVKTGDIVKVKVMVVEVERKRIGLTMRLTDTAEESAADGSVVTRSQTTRRNKPAPSPRPAAKSWEKQPENAMAAAFARLK